METGRWMTLGAALAALMTAQLLGTAAGTLVSGNKLLAVQAGLWTPAAGLSLAFVFYRPIAARISALCRWAALPGHHLPRREGLSILEGTLFPVFLVVASLLTAYTLADPDRAKILVREDGLLENLTALFYLLAAAASLFHARRAGPLRWLRLHLAGLGALFFIVGMEEISWGQRIFQIDTPEMLAAVNVQGELTLHNIWSISLFTYPALAVTTTLLFILPLARHISLHARNLMDAVQFPAGPAIYAGLYAAAVAAYAVIGLGYGTPTPLPISWYGHAPHLDDEFLEFLVSFLFLIAAIGNWRLAANTGRSVLTRLAST